MLVVYQFGDGRKIGHTYLNSTDGPRATDAEDRVVRGAVGRNVAAAG
jgi:hypothetical protein